MSTAADPRTELPKAWDPASEAEIYARWVELGVFTPPAEPVGEPYTVVIPPPNVTGSLHMGHALGHTLMDALTRRKRMQGFDALWLPGSDHAGIATQSVVERELGAEGTSRLELGREAFLERVWEWKATYGGRITDQMRRLGDGVDWTRERFTLDAGLSRAVRVAFKKLYDDGLIYRAERIVNWSPQLRSALSDIEVEYRDVEGELVSISYGPLEVATTRVETMLGDTGVAVHPDDPRYAHLVGTTLTLPITGRQIPVVADAHVDPAFGSGAVKITPAHDPNDFAIAARHGLPAVTVLDEDAVVTGTGTRFDGMDRFTARREVTEELRAQGLVTAEKRPYVHSVGHDSRTGVQIEPRLSLQWFVEVEPLARAAGDAVRAGRTTISPPELASRYFAWVDDMHDWCISRQLWWGHRIPVWYGPDGQVVVPADGEDPPAGEGWHQDPDVLDTWFSSALWPCSTLGWPDPTADLARFYPTSVLVTGYDIIFFWVARMMMFCTYVLPEMPFAQVALTGLVRDQYGKKMSKSAGNVVDPLEWMDAYGADALRFTLARAANPGVDAPIGEDWVKGSRNFITKIYNGTRFALLNGASTASALPARAERTTADRWVLSRLDAVVAGTDALYEAFEFAKACDLAYHFAWDEVFDWYLELSKAQLDDPETAPGTRAVLGHVFDALLRLLHPVTPFVTEALWRELTGGTSVVTAAWPQVAGHRDPAAEAEVERFQAVVTEVRRFRSEQQVQPRKRVPAVLRSGPDPLAAGWHRQLSALADLDVAPGLAERVPDGWAVVEAAGVTLGLDLSAAVDADRERARLTKALAAAGKERDKLGTKLANASFVERAAPAAVADARRRLAVAEAEIERTQALLAAVGSP